MKYIFLISIFFVFFNSLAQDKGSFSIGFKNGLTYSCIAIDNSIGTYNNISGYYTGLLVDYKIRPKIIIETNIDYYQNGYNLKISSDGWFYFLPNSYFKSNDKVIQNYLYNSNLIGYCFCLLTSILNWQKWIQLQWAPLNCQKLLGIII